MQRKRDEDVFSKGKQTELMDEIGLYLEKMSKLLVQMTDELDRQDKVLEKMASQIGDTDKKNSDSSLIGSQQLTRESLEIAKSSTTALVKKGEQLDRINESIRTSRRPLTSSHFVLYSPQPVARHAACDSADEKNESKVLLRATK